MLKKILFVSFLGIVIISFLLVGLLSEPEIRSVVIKHLANDLLHQALLVKDDYLRLLQKTTDPLIIQPVVKKTATFSGSRVTVIAKNGVVLGDSEVPLNNLSQLENHADRPEVIEASNRGVGKSVRYSRTLGKDLVYLALLLKDNAGRKVGYLRLAAPVSYASELLLKLSTPVLLSFLVVFVLAAFFSFVFSRFFFVPIEGLVAISEKIGRGEIPQTIVRKSRFEVGVLEKALEEMSQSLADSFKKLAEERSQGWAIISNMVEGVIALDGSGKIVVINPVVEKLFECSRSEVVGKLAREGIRNNEIVGFMEEVLLTGKPREKEIELYTPTHKYFMAHAGPIRGTQGELLGVVCVLHDVTELRKMERYRSEFFANVAHEFKTPLAAIHSYCQTLLEGAINDSEHNLDFLKKIDKHAMNLAGLVDDVLEISRLEAKEGLPPFSLVDVVEVVNSAVENISHKAKEKKISLGKEFVGTNLQIRGINEQIFRAVSNLLENAVSYTPEGGKVEVSCAREKDKVLISVRDTGIGISKEHLPRIFERFYRVDPARSRQLGGTGLGLAIVKHVMEVHGGSVSVESEVGKGSKFTLIFPAK